MKISWIEANKLAASGIPLGRRDLESLHEQGIRAIVTLTEHPLTVQQTITLDVLAEIGLQTLHIPIRDMYPPESAGAVYRMQRFIHTMHKENKPVFIHCHAGVGRTGTMLHAYYLAEGLSLDEAREKIKLTRPTCQFFMLTPSQQTFLRTFAKNID